MKVHLGNIDDDNLRCGVHIRAHPCGIHLWTWETWSVNILGNHISHKYSNLLFKNCVALFCSIQINFLIFFFLWLLSFKTDVICLMDIAINFLSCYQDTLTKKIVLDGRQIASHYNRNYFWIDVFSSLPDRIIVMWVSFLSCQLLPSSENAKIRRYLKKNFFEFN